MKFDDHTLNDLDIVPSGDDKMSIWKMFNHTATTGGKIKLSKLLITPLDDLNKIVDRQETLKYIIANIENWREYPFTDKLLKDVHSYLSSQIIPVPSTNLLELKLIKLRYKDNYFQLLQGMLNLRKFFNFIQELYMKHDSEILPENLNKIFLQIKSFISNNNIKSFLEISKENNIPTTNVYRFDNLFRGSLLFTIKNMLEICYIIDALISLAKIIKKHEFNFPIFSKSKTPLFKIQGLYHPFLRDPKCYEINISRENSFIFLTGPNMAGKTTFLKACGIAVYLAHLGLAVPSKSLEISVFDILVSSVNTQDNINLGYSYFYSEVKRVKTVAETIIHENTAFIILDELFKGTNIHDAYEASKKVIQGFAKWKENHIYLLSSHLIELVNDPQTRDVLNCIYFDAEIINDNPVFSYNLKKGVSEQRLGLKILEKEKIFELLKIDI